MLLVALPQKPAESTISKEENRSYEEGESSHGECQKYGCDERSAPQEWPIPCHRKGQRGNLAFLTEPESGESTDDKEREVSSERNSHGDKSREECFEHKEREKGKPQHREEFGEEQGSDAEKATLTPLIQFFFE